ncbi:FxSxx-COOH system tetratricopeptide repeat protein [Streptomyces sp. NPDC048057]|uniref:FxSxx-COOH system tetratricopeptide repeat protein n=1 Tax=Streptomyces sp. NPDC048057 TaxID=3155628 RepID=UPI0033DCC5F7
MTAPASPADPPPPVRDAGPEAGHGSAPERELPTWTELADALYLAAWQDAAVPLFDVPGRAALVRGERPRKDGRPDPVPPEVRPLRPPVAPRTDTTAPPLVEQAEGPEGSEGSEGSLPDEQQPPEASAPPRDTPTQPAPPSELSWARAALRRPRLPRRPADDARRPAQPRLADSLALGRALRPLRLVDTSPHARELDEEATAEQAALTGVWAPVCRTLPERRLDLLLLVDASASMALWSHTAHQIAELMEQLAAFRTVRTVRWDLDDDAAGATAAPEVHGRAGQLLLAVTDGGHRAWRTGRAASLLHRLGRSSPVAVLSLLPQHLWDLTLPTATRTRLRAPSSAVPNRAYEADWKHPQADALGTDPAPPAELPGDGAAPVPVPVVELRPASLGRWARLVAADGGEWHALASLWTAEDEDLRSAAVGPVPASLPDVVTAPQGEGGTGGRAEPSAVQRARRAAATVRRFRAVASPTAYALAQRLAAAPLNLPVMRLLQQALPGAQFWNLAEIVLLGLVHRSDESADAEDAHRVSFDFRAGVREELLSRGSRVETVRALRQIEQDLGPWLDAVWGAGGSALVAPEGDHPDPPMAEHTRPFVAHLYTALCAVSGPYLARANHLGRMLQSTAPGRPAALRGAAGAEGKRPSGYSSGEMSSKPKKPPADALDYGPWTPLDPHQANTPRSAATSPLTPSTAALPPAPPTQLSATEPTPPPAQPEPASPQSTPPDQSSRSAGSPQPTPTPSAPPSTAPARPRQGGIAVSAGQPVAQGPRSPHDPPRIWGNVPQRNRNFTGREVLLDSLRERLTGGVAAVLPEALHGMGGVGKSQIAIEYVYRNSRDYRLIWWIPAEQENQIVQSVIELGEEMGLQVGSERSAVPAVLDALRRGEPYRDWLLVFDNAENPKVVRKYFPSDGPGRIIVTSRNFQWSTDASSLEVDVFTREESVALLRRRSPQLPDESVDHLAAALGDLPLAVEQAAVWLAETGMPVQQYLEVYERNFTELMQSEPPGDYPLSVAAAWNVSLGRLRETRPDALHLLQVCAFFAPEPIEWDLFSAVRGISVPPELQSALDDPVKLGRAIREIGRYALARIDHRQNTVQMHRLVQRVLIEQMNAQERATMRHAAHQLLAHADPRNPQRVTYWPRYSSLLSHVRASNAVECEEPWTRRLVLNEVWFLRARGDHAGALELGERAAEIWRGHLGDEDEEVMAIDHQIAQALREQGADLPRSYEMQSVLVERFRRVYGEAHEDTLQAQSFMAIHHRNRGAFDEAREMDRQVYEASQREFGADDPATLLAGHNYAVSLRLAGDAEKALELDYDTWQRRIETLGEDHLYTLTTRDAYLLDLQELGRYEDALEGYEVLAEEVAEKLGETHPFTSLVNRNRGVTRRKQGDHEGAYTLSRRYVELTSELFGTNSRNHLLLSVSHANDLRQIGKLQESRWLCEQTLETHRLRYGREHPHSYACAMNLAVTLRLLQQPEAALELDREAVEGLSRSLGATHPRTLLARMNLASDHFALGRPEEAHAIDAAVAEESARLRENHPANLAVQLNLSHDLKALRRTEESEQMYAGAVKRYRSALGPSHPATTDAENGLRANADIDLILL